MAEEDKYHGSKLLRFFVYNSTYGPGEGEEEKKIVYYYPASDSKEVQVKYVGLAEAVERFSSVFSDRQIESLHTQKARTVFLKPQEAETQAGTHAQTQAVTHAQTQAGNFRLVLTVSAPYTVNNKRDDTTYHGDSLHDNVLMAMLQRAYDMFALFTGGFGQTEDSCRKRAEAFFSRYIPAQNAKSGDVVSELFSAVQFLTLEPADFLHVQSFVSRLQDEFCHVVDKCVFLHNGSVVWSGLQQNETQLIYQYIYTSLFPAAMHSSNSNNMSPFGGHQGRFLTGPSSMNMSPDQVAALKIPIVHVDSKEFHLLVYHAISSTLCLLIPLEVEFSVEFFKRLDGHLGPRLTHMSADLLDVFGRASNTVSATDMAEPPSILSPTVPPVAPSGAVDNNSSITENANIKFVYYNKFNRAMKSTLPPHQHGSEDEIQHAIADIAHDIDRINQRGQKQMEKQSSPAVATEMSVKMSTDQWVVGKKVDQRDVYVAIQSKNSSLIDVAEEVDRMVANEFRNICLLDK